MIKMQEILNLSVEERIQVIGKIWESIDDTNEIKTAGAIEEELDKRLERYNKGETRFFSWGEIQK